jgi:hypothetical protein
LRSNGLGIDAFPREPNVNSKHNMSWEIPTQQIETEMEFFWGAFLDRPPRTILTRNIWVDVPTHP